MDSVIEDDGGGTTAVATSTGHDPPSSSALATMATAMVKMATTTMRNMEGGAGDDREDGRLALELMLCVVKNTGNTSSHAVSTLTVNSALPSPQIFFLLSIHFILFIVQFGILVLMN
jgi:hypothetical protein